MRPVETDAEDLLVYDGDCSFCTSCARWISARWAGSRRSVAWQHLDTGDLDRLGLTHEDVRRAVWWVDARGARSRGHVAIGWALRATHGWPAAVGAMILVPPFRWVAAVVYPLVARWRHLLPGGTPACRL